MRKLLLDVLGDNYGKITQICVNGKTWYKAQDVCKILGLVNTSVAVRGSNVRMGYFGIDQEDIYRLRPYKSATLYISEPGMFKLILKSRKPAAYMIKVKLSVEVLPAIMRSGSFAERQADNYLKQGFSLEEVISCKCGGKCKG